MSNYLAAEGTLKNNTNAILEITGYNYEDAVKSMIDDTSFDSLVDDGGKPDIVGGAGSVQCHYDKTDTTGQGTLVAGQSITLNIYPTGDTSGEDYLGGTVTITKRRITGQRGNLVELEVDFVGKLDDSSVP